MCGDVVGVHGQVFNDFGDAFDVLDKNGEDLPECIIQSIEIAENALVTLLPNALHNLENGNEVLFADVDGMQLLEGQTHSGDNKDVKSGSINDTIWKVTVEKANSFRIGDTRMYQPFKLQGISKPLRPKLTLKFKSFADTMSGLEGPYDGNMFISDFEKLDHNDKAHLAFKTLDLYKVQFKQKPRPWNGEDALNFIKIACELKPELKTANFESTKAELKFLCQFAFTAEGVLNPLCAFFGGFIAQDCIKAITNKFTPTSQVFYYNAVEVLPQFEIAEDLTAETLSAAVKHI